MRNHEPFFVALLLAGLYLCQLLGFGRSFFFSLLNRERFRDLGKEVAFGMDSVWESAWDLFPDSVASTASPYFILFTFIFYGFLGGSSLYRVTIRVLTFLLHLIAIGVVSILLVAIVEKFRETCGAARNQWHAPSPNSNSLPNFKVIQALARVSGGSRNAAVLLGDIYAEIAQMESAGASESELDQFLRDQIQQEIKGIIKRVFLFIPRRVREYFYEEVD